MTGEYREATRIVLHDHYTVLALPGCDGSVFAEFESDAWHVDGDALGALFGMFGYDTPREFRGEGLTVRRLPVETHQNSWGVFDRQGDSSTGRIEAKILGERLLDLRLTHNLGNPDAWEQEVTYSGGFTIEWR